MWVQVRSGANDHIQKHATKFSKLPSWNLFYRRTTEPKYTENEMILLLYKHWCIQKHTTFILNNWLYRVLNLSYKSKIQRKPNQQNTTESQSSKCSFCSCASIERETTNFTYTSLKFSEGIEILQLKTLTWMWPTHFPNLKFL